MYQDPRLTFNAMSMRLYLFTGLIAIVGIGHAAIASGESPAAPATKANSSELTGAIDRYLNDAWENASVAPAEPADDAAFMRRLYLDLVGRIPSVAEARAFLDDVRPEKRRLLIESLASSGGHARHFATTWRRIWVPQADTIEFDNLAEDFETWAAVRLRDNVPYDRMVHELLTTPARPPGRSKQTAQSEHQVSPRGFLAASQFKPENLAANATRAFLGLNLDCAQCHNHPFSRWTQDQFWQTAAFFVAPAKAPEETAPSLFIAIPNTPRSVRPAFLDNRAPVWPDSLDSETGRRLFADWVTSRENPYFARNAVNRMWAQFFGRGLVEPLDDISEDNPSAHPKLLAEITAAFIASGHDLRYLARAFAQTRAYQLSPSSPEDGEKEQRELFACMPVRGLTGEQLYDSLRVASGKPLERQDLLGKQTGNVRTAFAARMLISRPVEAERSIVQALAQMNGALILELTTEKSSPTLAVAAESPFFNSQEKVEFLFLAALNRRPSDKESSRLVNYIEESGERTVSQSLADIFWSLLNCSEFNTNH